MLCTLKTRWRRWLGQKTRWDTPHWVTLLDSKYTSWASGVLSGETLDWHRASREAVREFWSRAIDIASIEQLRGLDNIYAADMAGL